MSSSTRSGRERMQRLLEELPGVADVVWAVTSRLRAAPGPTRVLLTAVDEGAGTTFLSAATAIGLLQHERVPVCLVEANLRRPALAGYLGLNGPGLGELLDGRAEIEDCLQEAPDCPGLLVLTAGARRERVPGEFATERLAVALDAAQRRCRYVVLDTAPVLEALETRRLLGQVDSALLVLRAGRTRSADAERAAQVLGEGVPLLGSILNAYRSEGPFGRDRRADREFERSVRIDRDRTRLELTAIPEPAAHEPPSAVPDPDASPLPATNGGLHEPEGPSVDSPTGAAPPRNVDVLERRIVKLTQMLEQAEAELVRIAALKDVDLGLQSLYRNGQGLSSAEEGLESKRSLMREIFTANLELQAAMPVDR